MFAGHKLYINAFIYSFQYGIQASEATKHSSACSFILPLSDLMSPSKFGAEGRGHCILRRQ